MSARRFSKSEPVCSEEGTATKSRRLGEDKQNRYIIVIRAVIVVRLIGIYTRDHHTGDTIWGKRVSLNIVRPLTRVPVMTSRLSVHVHVHVIN